jgi:hypothetical protein
LFFRFFRQTARIRKKLHYTNAPYRKEPILHCSVNFLHFQRKRKRQMDIFFNFPISETIRLA